MKRARRHSKRTFTAYGQQRQPAPQPVPAVADQKPAVPDIASQANNEQRIRKQRRHIWRQLYFPRPRTLVIVTCCLVVLGSGWWFFLRQPAPNADPFTTTILASLKFPVYYPTWLPAGYRIDPKSVQEPQANVVVVTMRGPHGAKLYMSEIPRPNRWNIGGYFNSLGNLKEIAVDGGAIAVGNGSGSTIVANRLYNNTWVLSNTNGSIPFDELIKMLKSLQLAY